MCQEGTDETNKSFNHSPVIYFISGMLRANFSSIKNCLNTQYFLIAQSNFTLKLLWRMLEQTHAAEAQAQLQPLPEPLTETPCGAGQHLYGENSTAIYLRGYAPKRAS